MDNDNNELEWRRHLLTALDGLAKKVDENSAEHVIIRTEIASVKNDMVALKASDPDKKITEYVNSSRGWRMIIVGQIVTILLIVASGIWWGATLDEEVEGLQRNQIRNLQDVDDLKLTSTGYREFRTKVTAIIK